LSKKKFLALIFVACCFCKVFSRIPTGMFDLPDELVLTAVNQLRLSKYVSFHRALKTAVTLQGARLRSQLHPCQNLVILRRSNIDNKPFVGGWAKVKEHLGLYLSANFLFADRILLAEGTTDETYLPLILQGLIERGKFAGDLNSFAVHSSLNDSETVASANIYTKEDRRVAVLVDGDDAGNKRKARVEAWSKQANRKCPVVILSEFKPAPCSIEDFLEPIAFKEAVVLACKEAIKAGVLDQRDNWEATFRAQANTKEKKSLGKRVEDILTELFGEAISDVWIARKYGEVLRTQDSKQKVASDAYWEDIVLQRLANAIWKALDLPIRGDVKGIPLTTGETPDQ
jgi:hypothetical protein